MTDASSSPTRAFLGIACLAMVSGSAASQSSRTYSLKANYIAGEHHSYKISTAIYGFAPNNQALGLLFDMKMKVVKVVRGMGTIVLIPSTPKSGKMVFPGMLTKATVVLDRLNRPVASSTTGQVFIMFSKHPVKIGDQWTGLSNLVLTGKKGAMVETAYQLLSVQSVNGRQIAEIGMELGGLAKGTGTALVDVADGSLLSSDMKLSAAVSKDKVFPVEIELKREN